MSVTSLFLEMEDKTVLIVGAGSVGLRRARRFLDAKAQVNIVTRSIDDKIKEELISKGAVFYNNDKLDELIEDCDLVVIATNNLELNREIALKAEDKLINCASDITLSNVIVPSTFKIGPVTFSIYTDSKSPLMAKELRKKIQAIITPEDISYIELQEYVRTLLKESVDSQADRKDYMIKINENETIMKLISEGKIDQAKDYAKTIINNINQS